MITLEQIKKIGHGLPPECTNPATGSVCLYTAPGGEHCIIGEVCKRLGLDVPTASDADNETAIGYIAQKGRWVGMFEPDAMVWAAIAQIQGQWGFPWKACVLSADNSVAPRIKIP